MNELIRYWKLWQINPSGEGPGVRDCSIASNQSFLRSRQVTNSQATDYLLALFNTIAADDFERSQAGLCLRCYVSWPIVNACRKLGSLFSQARFTYRDLLPFVLNDDGKTLIILSPDRKKQLELSSTGHTKALAFSVFSVRIMHTFTAHDSTSMRMENWAY